MFKARISSTRHTHTPVKAKADGQVHDWRKQYSTNKVRVERYHRPDAPVLGFLGCWIRAKVNAASRCDHWDAVMAVLVLRGQGQEAFLHSETFAYVPSSMSRDESVSRQTRGTQRYTRTVDEKKERKDARRWPSGAMRGTLDREGSLPQKMQAWER